MRRRLNGSVRLSPVVWSCDHCLAKHKGYHDKRRWSARVQDLADVDIGVLSMAMPTSLGCGFCHVVGLWFL